MDDKIKSFRRWWNREESDSDKLSDLRRIYNNSQEFYKLKIDSLEQKIKEMEKSKESLTNNEKSRLIYLENKTSDQELDNHHLSSENKSLKECIVNIKKEMDQNRNNYLKIMHELCK
jgi:hypothetical protein